MAKTEAVSMGLLISPRPALISAILALLLIGFPLLAIDSIQISLMQREIDGANTRARELLVTTPSATYVPPLPAILQSLYTPAGMDHLAASRLPADGLAPLTHWAQQYIYDHQFPKECPPTARFLSVGSGAGMGSQMHVASWHLGLAIETNRIMIWQSNAGRDYVTPELCGSVRNWDCFYQPISSCQPHALSPSNATNGTYSDVFHLFFNEQLKPDADPPPPEDLRVLFAPEGDNKGAFVPTVFVKALQEFMPGMSDRAMKYWWRAQGIAFLMRPNANTTAGVWELRQKYFSTTASKPAAQVPTVYSRVDNASEFLPLPRGTISTHVRHGDKHTEMELVPWTRYFSAARELQSRHPLGVSTNIFVSTDDPSVIDEATATTAGTEWRAIYSSITRISTSETGVKPLLDLAGNLVHLHLLQLLMALECDAWVGTRGSNINRMIDELRCIWVPKCQFPYVEVGVYDEHFGWR